MRKQDNLRICLEMPNYTVVGACGTKLKNRY